LPKNEAGASFFIAQPYINSLLDENRSLAERLENQKVWTGDLSDCHQDMGACNRSTFASESREDWCAELHKSFPTLIKDSDLVESFSRVTVVENFSRVTVGADNMASELAEIKNMISGGYEMKCSTNVKKVH